MGNRTGRPVGLILTALFRGGTSHSQTPLRHSRRRTLGRVPPTRVLLLLLLLLLLHRPASAFALRAHGARRSARLMTGADGLSSKAAWRDCGPLGQGGGSTVRRVESSTSGAELAAKVHEDVESYHRELELLSYFGKAYRHDSRKRDFVVRIIDASETGLGGPTIYMELADGGSLKSKLTDELSEHEVQPYAKQMLEILSYLHGEHNIAHNDFKLENLLIIGVAGLKKRLKVCDLDAADRIGKLRSLKATPYICAPEMAQHIVKGGNGLKVSAAEDIWALGVMVMHMLSGQPPFATGEGDAEAKYLPIADLTPYDVKQAIRKVTPTGQLEAFLLQCLSIDPAERGSADELMRRGWIAGSNATEVIRQTNGVMNTMVRQMDSIQEGVEEVRENTQKIVSATQRLEAVMDEVKDDLRQKSEELKWLREKTSATFNVIKAEAEGECGVPRLVTIRPVSAEWQGDWHENLFSNIAKQARTAVKATVILEMQFLCEKTLRPVAGHHGYRREIPSDELAEFMESVTPLLSATMGVLHVIAQVAKPVIKVAAVAHGVNPNLAEELGLKDIGDMVLFGGTTIDDMLELSPWDDSDEEEEDDSDDEIGEVQDATDRNEALLAFATETAQATEDLAEKVGVALPRPNEVREMSEKKKKAQARRSVDQVKRWIKLSGREGDLEKQVIGGLQKTVMQDGRVLWLSHDARLEWDKVDEEKLMEQREAALEEELRSPVMARPDDPLDTSTEFAPLVGLDESSEAAPAQDRPIVDRASQAINSMKEQASYGINSMKEQASNGCDMHCRCTVM
eukprot:COSAG02_NODE_798_length_17086_cov_72.770295_6_plen_797_part_00